MTNEEKIFKIEKIRKYEKEISDENKKVISSTFFMGAESLTAALVFSAISKHIDTISLSSLVAPIMLANLNSAFALKNLKNLLKSINRKTFLNIRIEAINDELEFDKLEEIKGRKKW